MEALKKFTSGSGASSAVSAGGPNAFIGMAMAQAAKLFDSQGVVRSSVQARSCD